jgi:hypothetical protein
MAIVQELEGDSFSQAQMLFVFQTFIWRTAAVGVLDYLLLFWSEFNRHLD